MMQIYYLKLLFKNVNAEHCKTTHSHFTHYAKNSLIDSLLNYNFRHVGLVVFTKMNEAASHLGHLPFRHAF